MYSRKLEMNNQRYNLELYKGLAAYLTDCIATSHNVIIEAVAKQHVEGI